MESLEKAVHDESVKPIKLPFQLFEKITGNFSDYITEGGFGKVYKGTLQNGTVAVKMLKETKNDQGYEDQYSELHCMMKTKHKNIVRFLGYSWVADTELRYGEANRGYMEDVNRRLLLCSEYLPKGSLDRYIQGLGLIVGLVSDLKPQNILLDDNMVPKITDFGLSRLFHEGQNEGYSVETRGTRFYIAPELARTNTFTTKTDIYALGVTIIDILVGFDKREKLVGSLAHGHCQVGGCKVNQVLEIWKEALEGHPRLKYQVQVCAQMAVRCLDLDPNDDTKCDYCTAATDKKNSHPSPISLPAVGQIREKDKLRPPEQRPDAIEIINILRETERGHPMGEDRGRGPLLLDIHPRVLCIPASKKKDGCAEDKKKKKKKKKKEKENKSEAANSEDNNKKKKSLSSSSSLSSAAAAAEAITEDSCVLSLTNRSRHHIGFWVEEHPDISCSYYDGKKIVGPWSTRTVSLALRPQEFPPVSTQGMVKIHMVKMSPENANTEALKEIQRSRGNKGDEEVLIDAVVVCPLVGHVKIVEPVAHPIWTMDVHPVKPWILMGRPESVSIWDYKMQKQMQLGLQSMSGSARVTAVKFIPRTQETKEEQWIVIGDSSGVIRIISYDTNTVMKTIKNSSRSICSLAIHPEKPVLLSVDEGGVVNLMCWNESSFRFSHQLFIKHKKDKVFSKLQVRFYQMDSNTFVSVDPVGAMKLWEETTDSTAQPNTNNDIRPRTAYSRKPCNCPCGQFNYLCTNTDRPYVIDTDYSRAKIWNFRTKKTVHTFYCPRKIDGVSSISAAAWHPTLPLKVVASYPYTSSPAIWFCNHTNYRVQKIIEMPNQGDKIVEFGFIGTTSLVIRYMPNEKTVHYAVKIMDIDMAAIAYRH
ncbi:hypothetical protein U9M48_002158 [Paspalum notatum var. saurae]|uniref:Protein kinase domain-containing protein n=1 Tax=Paspalum notatum var. saurae TaxID=547442 RepID=A0AAQ3PJ25_PASNO